MLQEAQFEMRKLRQQIQKWIQNDALTITSKASNKPDPQSSATKSPPISALNIPSQQPHTSQTSSHNTSYQTTATPIQTLISRLQLMDAKVTTEVENVKSTVKQQIDQGIDQKL